MSAFHFEHFATLLMTIAFGFGMITYYSQPIPGFGVSFYHLIIDQGQIIGRVTSVSDSPTLQQVIGMAFIAPECAAAGTPFSIRLDDGGWRIQRLSR